MKVFLKAAIAAVVIASAAGCASTSKDAELVAPVGAEYVKTGARAHDVRMVAKMDDVGDYTLDGAPAQKKPVKKNTPKNKITTTFGY